MAKKTSKIRSRGKRTGARGGKKRTETEPQARGIPRGVPDRKISETLLDFVKPLTMELVDENTSTEQIHDLLKIAVTVWNAMVMEEWGHGPRYLDEVRATLKDARLGNMGSFVEALVERKRERFAHDLRAISHFEVQPDPEDGFRIFAEARLARSLMREH